MPDLLDHLLTVSDEGNRPAEVLRKLTRQLHTFGKQHGLQGTKTLYTDFAFDSEQIWGQLQFHTNAVLPKLDSDLQELDQTLEGVEEGAEEDVVEDDVAGKGETGEEDEEADDDVAGKGEMGEEEDEEEEGEDEDEDEEDEEEVAEKVVEISKKRQKGSEGGDDEEEEEEDEEEEDEEDEDEETGGFAMGSSEHMDSEDEELEEALATYEGTLEREGTLKKKKEKKGMSEEDEDEAALTEMYGEGAFDPDEDMKFAGEMGDEEEEDDELEDDMEEDDLAGDMGEDDEGDEVAEKDFEEESQHPASASSIQSQHRLVDADAEEEEVGEEDPNKEINDNADNSESAQLVDKLEKKLLEPKSWAMSGEVSAKQRPLNSLLEDEFVVDHALKQVPVISAEMTKSLEERIKKRIKDKIFDDVYPKISMTSVDDVDTRKLPFDSQKSALSLVDLYEKDYVDKMKLEKAKNPNTDQEVAEELTFEQKEEREALYLWMRVSKALDTLCNAHYTPKALGQSDLKCTVIKAPALRMEEATPTAVSNAQMLTPEELYNMPGKRSHLAFKSQEELTRHDRAVLRRTVKSSIRKKNKRQEMEAEQKEMSKKLHKKAEREAKIAHAEAAGEEPPAAEDEVKMLHPKHKKRKIWAKHNARAEGA